MTHPVGLSMRIPRLFVLLMIGHPVTQTTTLTQKMYKNKTANGARRFRKLLACVCVDRGGIRSPIQLLPLHGCVANHEEREGSMDGQRHLFIPCSELFRKWQQSSSHLLLHGISWKKLLPVDKSVQLLHGCVAN
ncbi:hypothetical protein NPIL_578031 [Nephila pilipes]|uniref:Secreted protein n=1 Tax=Nephila pilipes TaxID=299642 RepID=A0A8X6TWG0_NEPPI|nr:hypothetical protein NPIL_578031 [Nephila pilipes]